MNETKHSPLPWSVDEIQKWLVYTDYRDRVCDCDDEGDAALICLAVNSYDLMRAELCHIRNKAMFNGNHAQVNRIDAILDKEALDE